MKIIVIVFPTSLLIGKQKVELLNRFENGVQVLTKAVDERAVKKGKKGGPSSTSLSLPLSLPQSLLLSLPQSATSARPNSAVEGISLKRKRKGK